MIKTIQYTIAVFLIILLSLPAMSQEPKKIKWYSIEEAAALNKKKKNKKKIFVDLYTSWCGWCKKMDSNTFTDPVIVEYMNDNFWPVKLDAETSDTITINGQQYVNPKPGARRSSHQLAVALLQGKMSYPSFAFLDEEIKLITILPGYNPPEKLEPILHYIGEGAYKEESYQDFISNFKGSFKE
jgi:thioredoxin-related protein